MDKKSYASSLATQESRAQVIVQLSLPLSQRQFVGGAILREPTCQVDEDGDLPISGQRLLDEGACRLFGGQISL